MHLRIPCAHAWDIAPGWSSMYPSDQATLADMDTYLSNSLAHGNGAGGMDPLLHWVGRTLRRIAPAQAYQAITRAVVGYMQRDKDEFQCRLLTVSDLIEGHGLQLVDLLKVRGTCAHVFLWGGVWGWHFLAGGKEGPDMHRKTLANAQLKQGPGAIDLVHAILRYHC
jgi:hypothetical protein